MANEQNLVKGDVAHKLTAEEQSMGGKRSAEVPFSKIDDIGAGMYKGEKVARESRR